MPHRKALAMRASAPNAGRAVKARPARPI
jgi:hypothetical protein